MFYREIFDHGYIQINWTVLNVTKREIIYFMARFHGRYHGRKIVSILPTFRYYCLRGDEKSQYNARKNTSYISHRSRPRRVISLHEEPSSARFCPPRINTTSTNHANINRNSFVSGYISSLPQNVLYRVSFASRSLKPTPSLPSPRRGHFPVTSVHLAVIRGIFSRPEEKPFSKLLQLI